MDHTTGADAHHVPSLRHWQCPTLSTSPPYSCRWACGIQTQTLASAYMHQATECPSRLVECECGARMPFCRIVAHRERTCPATPRVTPTHVRLARERACHAARGASLAINTQVARVVAQVVAAAAALVAVHCATRARDALPPHERTEAAFAAFVSRSAATSPWADRIAQFHEGHCDHRHAQCTTCHWLSRVVAWHTRTVHGSTSDSLRAPCPFPLCDHHVLPCFWPNCPERIPLRDREYHALLCTNASPTCPTCDETTVPHPRRHVRGTKRVVYSSLGWVERKWHTLQCRRVQAEAPDRAPS